MSFMTGSAKFLIISHLLPVRQLELDLSNEVQTFTITDKHPSTVTEQLFCLKIRHP